MKILKGIVLLVFASGLAGCGSAPVPTTPTTVAQPTKPPAATGFAFAKVTLSGVVSEVTPMGEVPIEGVSVYCEPCGEATHTYAYTDNNGFYSFDGVWVSPGITTQIWVGKEDYLYPSGRDGWTNVMVNGDTRFDIQLTRR
jgi:hypothetical protein